MLYCLQAIKIKAIVQSRKKMSPLYRSYGYCTFKDCSVCFSVSVSNGVQHLLLKVVFSTDSARHAHGERQSRFVRSKRRKDLQEVLQHQSPSTVYNQLFNTITDTEFTSGKRDKVGRSPQVIQKISSEANLSKQRDPDLFKSLMLIKEEMNENNSNTAGTIASSITKPVPCAILLSNYFHTAALIWSQKFIIIRDRTRVACTEFNVRQIKARQ